MCSLGVGNYYGIFSGVIIVFSFVFKGKKLIEFVGKNFLINLFKKGIGFGYLNVIIGVLFKYMFDVYERVRELRKVIGFIVRLNYLYFFLFRNYS